MTNLFSENMKVADLILTNCRLLYVLSCFGIELGLEEITIKQLCEQKKISMPLFLLVCNIYTYDDYRPDAKAMNNIPLEGVMEYLKNSHKDYIDVRMPKIISEIIELEDHCNFQRGEVLTRFCEKYRLEVILHFKYEEEVVFPYISKLLSGTKDSNYKIENYESNHSDIDGALNDLKNIIIKYLPNNCTLEKSREALINLFMFEHDLSKHTLVEDKILISLTEDLERRTL